MTSSQPDFRGQLTRRRLLSGGLLGAAGLAVYAGEVERHWIELKEIEIYLRGLPEAFDGLRVAQLSDIHLDEFTEPFYLQRAIDKINALRADVVMLTGDFVSQGPRSFQFSIEAAWRCARMLTRLTCSERYAVLGNHDHVVGAREVAEALRANGIPVLDNRHTALERHGARLWLTGVEDPLAGRPDPDSAIPEKIRGLAHEPVILLCHGPDYVDALRATSVGRSIGLVLSGHTHGGQVRMPFYGPLILPEMGRRYVEGLFRLGDLQLYVNRGLGTVGVPFRFDCPPEITLLTLRRV